MATGDKVFKLQIATGNDAMRTLDDIADALEKTAGKLRHGQDSGRIIDGNGNVCGSFEITETESSAPKYRRPYEKG